ncbi:MAG: hypothetical protein CM15mP68_1140 [Pseudomonadota bacterium]|nr:MAG: hypothetical protein CM15mP68_1140 [Pseudomonadota bacterium]
MATASRNEQGCKSYEFYVGLADPDTLMLFQEWESMEALMEHFDTAHMDDFLQRLPDLVSGEIVTRRYAVQMMDEEEPLEAVTAEPIIHKRVWHCRIKRLRMSFSSASCSRRLRTNTAVHTPRPKAKTFPLTPQKQGFVVDY